MTDLFDRVCDLEETRDYLRAKLDAVEAERDRLRKFVEWAVSESAFSGYGLDGGDVQDKAEELGLLVEIGYDDVLDEGAGAEYGIEDGDSWYMLAWDPLADERRKAFLDRLSNEAKQRTD